jgi:hypothetical protein
MNYQAGPGHRNVWLWDSSQKLWGHSHGCALPRRSGGACMKAVEFLERNSGAYEGAVGFLEQTAEPMRE